MSINHIDLFSFLFKNDLVDSEELAISLVK